MTTAAPPATPDAHLAASQTADDFMALLRRTFTDTRTPVVSTDPLREALPGVTGALSQVALPAQCADVRAVTIGVLDQYEQRAAGDGYRSDPTAARYTAGGYGALQVQAALDRALAVFPGRNDIPQLEQKLTELEERYQVALADLAAAVNAADIGRVGEIRSEVELALPTQIHDVRTRLSELRIAQARAEAVAPRLRAQERHAAIEEARRELDLAAEHLQNKQAEHGVAWNTSSTARDAAARAANRVTELQKEHQQMLDQYEQDRQRRIRQLAGLPTGGWVA